MPQRRQTRKGHQSAVSISILDTALVIDRRRIITDLQRQLAEGTARSAIAGSFRLWIDCCWRITLHPQGGKTYAVL
jgi:hypothetical protein